jgi:rare lipoprotein A
VRRFKTVILGCILGAALGTAPPPALAAGPQQGPKATGATQHGIASYYHSRFNGRRMANGQRFDPRANVAAHKTLPFGTVVRVTNLKNGKSAIVRVVDRGPYVRGRIIDLAPSVAERLDMKEDGVVPVAVTLLRQPEELAEAR